MSTLSLTNVVSGNSIMASDVNNGWTAIKAVVNGDLDETNFAPGQLYSPAKIKQDGAAANDVMYWTGSAWDNTPYTTLTRGSLPQILARGSGTQTITNTITETDLINATVTANYMSTDRMLRLTMIGDITNVSTGTVLTWRLKFGGNTIWGEAMTLNSAYTATQYPWWAEFWLVNVGSASVQIAAGRISHIGLGAASVAGFGPDTIAAQAWASSGYVVWNAAENPAAALDVATTSDRAFQLSAQWGTATTNVTLRRHFYMLELL